MINGMPQLSPWEIRELCKQFPPAGYESGHKCRSALLHSRRISRPSYFAHVECFYFLQSLQNKLNADEAPGVFCFCRSAKSTGEFIQAG